MQKNILEILKNKPIPNKKKDITINLKPTVKSEVEIKTKIIDNRNEDFDRDSFLTNFKKSVNLKKDSFEQTFEETLKPTLEPLNPENVNLGLLEPILENEDSRIELEKGETTSEFIEPKLDDINESNKKVEINESLNTNLPINESILEESVKKDESELKEKDVSELKEKKDEFELKKKNESELKEKDVSELKEKDVSELKEKKEKKIKKIKNKKIKLKPLVLKTTVTSTGELPKKRVTKKPDLSLISESHEEEVIIGKKVDISRLPSEKEKVIVKASSYYLNNRKIFINFINSIFNKYKDDLIKDEADVNCDKDVERNFEPLTHQKIVRDYLNIYTPYRGLLLYHGLGSGKTCSSIIIAEGLKTSKKIMILTPASLRANYIQQLKQCGDLLFKKNQYWEFLSTREKPEYLNNLSEILNLSVEFINRNGGAWLVDIRKPSNYDSLTFEQKDNLDNQLNEMIRDKYQFVNYNGLRNRTLDILTMNGQINPFDNKVIIIDEAHNFVSRIVNKLKKQESISFRLYEYLMKATNCRIVLLTGTPIINYPNEISIMFNILRGYIKTWNLPLDVKTTKKIDENEIKKILMSNRNIAPFIDFIEYKSSKILTFTQNPFGFIGEYKDSKYEGLKNIDERGQISDGELIKLISKSLKYHDIEVNHSGIKIDNFKTLHDNLDNFQSFFVDSRSGELKNVSIFKRRILGLTSYFRDQEKLMPDFDYDKDIHIIKIPMSQFQFEKYEEVRAKERKQETNNKKKMKKGSNDLYNDSTSTYRIFSRAYCNFVFPNPIGRPMPNVEEDLDSTLEKKMDEDILDNATIEEKMENVDGRYTSDDRDDLLKKVVVDDTYNMRITNAMKQLEENNQLYLTPSGINLATSEDLTLQPLVSDKPTEKLGDALERVQLEQLLNPEKTSLSKIQEEDEYNKTSTSLSNKTGGLQIYSPKFLHILENVLDESHVGLHLIYSQFRTLEGIGILKLIFEANGFTQFKIKKNNLGDWILDISEEDMEKPKFALYTGTEDTDEKEIVRNIYNGMWEYVPETIKVELFKKSDNNLFGDIIKVIMITASGAEGINLKNTRFVHITEPYWHPVRMHQVIGRARRICSHEQLSEEYRNIKVFLYLMTFTDEQLKSDEAIELRLKDKGKLSNVPLTSDESLYEISNIKEELNKKILTAVKESAIDCNLYNKKDAKEQLVCYSFGNPDTEQFSIYPSLDKEESDDVAKINMVKINWRGKEVTIKGKKYILKQDNMEVYDYKSYELALKNKNNPILIGRLTRDPLTKKLKFETI